jgi:hypothetical protein
MEESTNTPFFSGQSNNNIIPFPKKNLRSHVPPVENVSAGENSRRKYIDHIVLSCANQISHALAQKGFDIFNTEFDPHYSFAMEALRSTLLMTMQLSHPFQEMVATSVQCISEESPDDNTS